MAQLVQLVERCDVCGAKLESEDVPVHLCKICQEMQFEEEYEN